MFFKLFRKSAPDDAVYSVYNSIVAQSRQQRFYADWGVPDTVTGRFDMISLHTALVLRRLKADAEGSIFGQALVDLFFKDMDRSLREMGAGDLAVPKKVRNMSKLFYGLVTALDEALAAADSNAVAAVLERNVYPAGNAGGAAALAAYLVAESKAYEQRSIASIIAPAGAAA